MRVKIVKLSCEAMMSLLRPDPAVLTRISGLPKDAKVLHCGASLWDNCVLLRVESSEWPPVPEGGQAEVIELTAHNLHVGELLRPLTEFMEGR